MRLKRKFYKAETLETAKNLLGKFIVRKWRGKEITGMIVETEAYIGPEDKASHAFLPRHLRKWRGEGKMTQRNKAEYLKGGHIYIYLVYGMHWQLNISTNKEGKPECVLIRALEPVIGGYKANDPSFEIKKITNGPGKLCKWLRLNKSFYGEDLCESKRIWLSDSISTRQALLTGRRNKKAKIRREEIAAVPRIGIDYAGKYWTAKPWRFYVKNNPFVSKPY